MKNALTISGLTKTYQDFILDHVSFAEIGRAHV